jgi:hypothetical protein
MEEQYPWILMEMLRLEFKELGLKRKKLVKNFKKRE